MLAAVFSFRGRLNRLQYFLGNVAVGIVLTLLAATVIGFIELAPTSRPALTMEVNAVLLVIAAPLAVWSAVSLQARRLRDVGLEPLLVIPLWIGSLGLAQIQPMLAVSISLALFACLFGWPGRRGGFSSNFDDGRIMTLAPASAFATISGRSRRRWR
jgi:uncharacterized membrane protein YhaH (DUF805 family)